MRMETELKSGQFLLKTYDPKDVTEEYVQWINKKSVNQYLGTARYKKYSMQEEKEYVDGILKSDDELLMAIVIYETGALIGNIHLTLEKVHKRCSIAYVIGDERYWGRGIATEAVRLATKWAFEHLAIARMDAGYYSVNAGSKKVLLKNGYKIEGVRKDYILLGDGTRCDEEETGLTRDDYISMITGNTVRI